MSILHFSLGKSIFDDRRADEFSRLIFGVWCRTLLWVVLRDSHIPESCVTGIISDLLRFLPPFKKTKNNTQTFICMRRKENCSQTDPVETNWGARFTTASGCGARANSCCAAIFVFTMSYNHLLSIIRDVGISLSVCQESQDLPARIGMMLTIYFCLCKHLPQRGE